MEPIISIVIFLVVVGLIMYILNAYLPLDAPYKNLINTVVICAVIIWLLLKLMAYLPLLRL